MMTESITDTETQKPDHSTGDQADHEAPEAAPHWTMSYERLSGLLQN